MSVDLRAAFHRDLAELDDRLALLFRLVGEAIEIASAILLTGDLSRCAELRARDAMIDSTCAGVEELVQWHLARQQAVGRDLRLLVTALRIAPELERSHDLAEHISHEADKCCRDIPDDARTIITAMAGVATAMWRDVSSAYVARDATAAARLGADDNELDVLHSELLAGLAGGGDDARLAITLALIGRFYERLGDHAVHLAERVRFLAVGESRPPTTPA